MLIKYKEDLKRAESKTESFTSFLQKLENADLKIPHASILEAHEKVSSEIDCLQCANCCSTTPALVEEEEFASLAKASNLPIGDFLKQKITTDSDGDFVFRHQPCSFLGPDNKCSIYENRPNACREYPHTDDKRFPKHMELNLENCGICPIVVRVIENLMENFDRK